MATNKALMFVIAFLVFTVALFVIISMHESLSIKLLRRRVPPMKSETGMMTSVLGETHGYEVANTTHVTRKPFVILVYTEFFGIKVWITLNGNCSSPRTLQTVQTGCTKDHFDLTYDKRRFLESQFVIFHARDMPSLNHLTTILKDKPSSQFWIYFLHESPNVTPDTTPLNGMFDLTHTYRADSDFWEPYGSYDEIPFANISQKDFSVGKSKLVSWMVSNCGARLRNSFVHELQKYITVDVFGSCSGEFGQPRPCVRGNESCTDTIKQYKFYLAFENALCEDYITEKYWGRLGDENIVPIVLGGANYTKLAIPGSYINVLDFKTVKDLADYLHYLDKNSTAYSGYFNWRQRYRLNDSPFFCSFCKILTLKTWYNSTGYQDLTDYWVTQGKCNVKDHIVLYILGHRSKSLTYFSLLMIFTLVTTVIIALVVFYKQVYKRALPV